MSRPYANESVFRAVADPTRRRMIELLRRHELSPQELAQRLRLTATTLSHHLGILRTSGVVTQRRYGRGRVYRIQIESLRGAGEWFRSQVRAPMAD